ncbi:unnamed protein product [Ceratitis capitata]|uniref:(Mediterranean fruit fly) hypothetical protein n=1 Tax=Ceratitis capitata TaxID=7213 RepID=A0A811U0C1_CERCA|nr:unnamed protein product [Ceratitis capitata]
MADLAEHQHHMRTIKKKAYRVNSYTRRMKRNNLQPNSHIHAPTRLVNKRQQASNEMMASSDPQPCPYRYQCPKSYHNTPPQSSSSSSSSRAHSDYLHELLSDALLGMLRMLIAALS